MIHTPTALVGSGEIELETVSAPAQPVFDKEEDDDVLIVDFEGIEEEEGSEEGEERVEVRERVVEGEERGLLDEGEEEPVARTAPAVPTPHALLGLLLVLLSGVVFSLNGVVVHILGTQHGFGAFSIGVYRFVLQGSIALVWAWRWPPPNGLLGDRGAWRLLASRAVCGSIAMLFFYFSLSTLPVGDATALMFTNPIVTSLLAAYFLSEPLLWLDFGAALVCFTGVVFVARPTALFGTPSSKEEAADSFNGVPRFFSVIVCLIASLLAAGAYISIRKLGGREPPVVLVIWVAGLGLLISMLMAFILEHKLSLPTNWLEAILCIAVGGLGFGGQMLLNRGMSLDKAGPSAAMRNIDVVMSVCFQAFIFFEYTPWTSILGSIFIIIGTVAIVFRRYHDHQKIGEANRERRNSDSATSQASEESDFDVDIDDFDIDDEDGDGDVDEDDQLATWVEK